MVYDINIFRKDVTRPLFTVGFLGLCLFLNFIKAMSEKEIEDIEEITIKPYEQVFEIDIIPKVSKKMFSLVEHLWTLSCGFMIVRIRGTF